MTETEKLRAKYTALSEKYSKEAADGEKRLLVISLARLLFFLLFFAILLPGLTENLHWLLIFLPLPFLGFLYLLKLYVRQTSKVRIFTNLSLINKHEADAAGGDLTNFDPGDRYLKADHDYANDADIFGVSSLFQYLNRTVTGSGSDTLAGWLSSPLPLAADIEQRQQAVKELSDRETWRQHFLASGRGVTLDNVNTTRLIEWLNETDFSEASIMWKLILIFLPAIVVALFLLMVSGLIHYSIFVAFFLINLSLVAGGAKKINRIHSLLSRRHHDLEMTGDLIRIIESEKFTSVLLSDLRNELASGNKSALYAIRRLSSLLKSFDSRLNMITGVLLNGFLLWDYQSVFRLGKWKREYRGYFKRWIDAVASFDAFISLGNYAANHQQNCYPAYDAEGNILKATSMGHPLIPSGERVCNDFSFPCTLSVCFISGANMAGKSTFLRTAAVNMVLAMAGAPVCAEQMTFTPLKLFTSMRTTDSLSGNESYFYAELKRLKSLKDRIGTGEKIFFILDEILKGTNSIDKSLGSRLFIAKMIENGGTGLIATHDLSICEMAADYQGKVINKCFEIMIDGEIITFDYILRDGITGKMNASLLMKQMGIID